MSIRTIISKEQVINDKINIDEFYAVLHDIYNYKVSDDEKRRLLVKSSRMFHRAYNNFLLNNPTLKMENIVASTAKYKYNTIQPIGNSALMTTPTKHGTLVSTMYSIKEHIVGKKIFEMSFQKKRMYKLAEYFGVFGKAGALVKTVLAVEAAKAKKALDKKVVDIKDKISKIPVPTRGNIANAALAFTLLNAMDIMNIPRERAKYGAKYGRRPGAIVGPIPLWSVQMIERARSDRKIKSRAIGDVFLAHQKGNRDIVRIDGTFSGPYRLLYILLLIRLQKEGEARQETLADNLTYLGQVVTHSDVTRTESRRLNYETHRTFPIITETHIILDMYIQTIEWHRSVEDGKNVIKYHLLFRKYYPSTGYKVFNPIPTLFDEDPSAGSGFELHDKWGRWRRWAEYSMDGIWKMIRFYGEIYGHLIIGNDGSTKEEMDKQAVNDVNKLVGSYVGSMYGLFDQYASIKGKNYKPGIGDIPGAPIQ